MLAVATRYPHRVTLTYFLVFVAIGMSGGLLGPALPHLAEMTGSSMGQIAVLFTARALGNMLGSVVSGMLVDRFPGHRVLLGMALLMATALAAVPFSQTLVILTAVVFLLGFAEVSINAGTNTLLLWTHGTASAPWISALHFCFGLGNMLVPLILVAALSLTGHVALAFWLVALYSLLLLWPLAGQDSPRPECRDAGERPSPPPRDPWRLAIFLLMFGLYVGMELTFAGWITAYGTLGGLPPADAALLVTLFWLTLSAGRLLAIPLLRRFSPWRVLRGCLVLGLVTAYFRRMMRDSFRAFRIRLARLNAYLNESLSGISVIQLFNRERASYRRFESLDREVLDASLGQVRAISLFFPIVGFIGTATLALLLVRYEFPGKSLLNGLILIPMVLPPFVGAIGMRQLLARFGSINLLLLDMGAISQPIDWLGGGSFWGVVILEALHLYPIMYLNLAAALANVLSVGSASQLLSAVCTAGTPARSRMTPCTLA